MCRQQLRTAGSPRAAPRLETRALPRWTKAVERARGFFHPVSVNLMGTEQNTTTNDQLLFRCSLDVEHRVAKGMVLIIKKVSSNKSDLILSEVTFFTIYIYVYILVSSL